MTDWNPITVWTYKECYGRTTYSDYDLNPNDVSAHLTNNPLIKEAMAGENEDATKFLVSLSDLKVDLSHDYGPNVWEEKIYPQIQKVVKSTIKVGQRNLEGHRPNSF